MRHGEGKLVVRDDRIRAAIVAGGNHCLRYVDERGEPSVSYPDNPNGSELACAGLCDATGRILGMMPHPEAHLSAYNHPDWPRRRSEAGFTEAGQGLRLFVNVVKAARESAALESGVAWRR